MIRAYREHWGYPVAAAILLVAFMVPPDLLKLLFESNGFIPHGHCYLWQPGLVWMHLISDALIALSYLAISTTLAYLVYQTRREIPFQWVFLAFGTFIVACGTTHFMEVITLWHPVYWLAGLLKIITAIASVATAVVLPPLVPKAKQLLEQAKLSEERRLHLEAANAKLKELDEFKTRLFTNVSHELRTPLTLILLPIENLLASQNLSAKQHQQLESIDRNAHLLLKHVNDLLDVYKLEAGQMEIDYTEVDLAQLVKVTAANFDGLAEEQHIEFTITAPDHVPTQLDEPKVQRVLLNLLSNAFKFTPAGGVIRCALSVSDTADPDTDETTLPQACIQVSDSGPGIPPELRSIIFERFQQGDGGVTRQTGGTGLGLAIVKEFVELQGGTVTVSEAPEGGACFTVKLPLRLSDKGPMAPAAALQPSPALVRSLVEEIRPYPEQPQAEQTRRLPEKPLVLIVEDNPEMRQFIENTLATDYQVATARDGQAALEQAIALRPDLILSDVMMPRLSGDQLVEQIRNQPELEGTPIIMLTAKADNALRVRLLQQGVQDYLMKPFSIEELKARVGNLITLKRTRNLLQRELASQSYDLENLAQELSLRKQELQLAYEILQHQAEELTQANRLKDEFLATVSHELRTPLNAILGWSRTLQSHTLDQARTVKALQTIERNASLQAHLVEDLLDVSQLLRGGLKLDMHPVELNPLIQTALQAVQATAESKGLSLVADLDETPNLVSGNLVRLQQVVQNLLSNAIKFTPASGQITVLLKYERGIARIEVSDTGQGIKPEFLPHVFDYFRQEDGSTARKYGGLGLGLAIIQQLVKLHNGDIQIQSAGEGQGVTAIVLLPLLVTATSTANR